MRKLITVVFAVIFAVVIINSAASSASPEELGPGLYAKLKTSRGDMVFELDYRGTPLTVANFAGLAKGMLNNSFKPLGIPYFDGLEIYRFMPGYALFIGEMSGREYDYFGYSLPREYGGEISAGEAGVLIMDGLPSEMSANRFFIALSGDDFLDSKYTRFGRIVSGQEVMNKLRLGDTINTVEIHQVGEEAESLSIDQNIFKRLLTAGREEEIKHYEAIDPAIADAIRSLGDQRQKSEKGIYYSVLKEGAGKSPRLGNQVSMHYTGYLLNGSIFDSSKARNQTFNFTLGQEIVIPGWIDMVVAMKVGEIRQVLIPPEMAYGENGFGPIEPNSWLIFEMELMSIVEQ